jgi:hypothetical protein
MPNVMGREFPYTPEGMAAAQQYSQAMGMRDGGPMGFRPLGYADGGVADNRLGSFLTPVDNRMGSLFLGGGMPPIDGPIASEEAQGRNPFFAADPARYTPSVAPYTEPPGQSNGSSALDSFRRDFGREPRDTAELREYMMSGGGGTPMGMRDGGSMGFRPLGMQAGGDVNRQVYGAFEQALNSLPMDKLAEYIYNNLPSLKSMAEENPARAAQLRSAMEKSGFEGYMRNLMQGREQSGNLGRIEGQRLSDRDVGDLMQGQEQMPQMQIPPQGMYDVPGYEPETGDFYSPQQYDDLVDRSPQQQVPQQMPAPSYPSLGDVEEGDQYIIPGTPPPGSVAPIPYDPNEIGVANGGYITRNMNRGGLMSLRRG